MFKKLLFTLALSILPFSQTFAEEMGIMAVINSADFVAVNEVIKINGSDSLVSENGEVTTFSWNIDEGKVFKKGEEISQSFNEIGKKKIVLSIQQGEEISKVEKNIFVYDKKALLITDKEDSLKINGIKEQAGINGSYLEVINLQNESVEFGSNKKNLTDFFEKEDFLKSADTIIFDSKNLKAIEALSSYLKHKEENGILKGKNLIKISDGSLKILKKTSSQYLKIINGEEIILTREEALNPIFQNKENGKIKEVLDTRLIEYLTVTKESSTSFFLPISNLLSLLIVEGVSSDTIYLLLALPLIAFLATFSRQVIGISSFGVYIPIITALSFMILGLKSGLLIIAFIIAASYLIKLILDKIELPFIPKAALTLSIMTLSFFGLIWLTIVFEIEMAIGLAIFPMLVISTIAEKFIGAQASEGLLGATSTMLQTILVAVVSFLIVDTSFVYNLIIGIPELTLIPLILIVVIGRFTGLRITEYIRFKNLMKEGAEE